MCVRVGVRACACVRACDLFTLGGLALSYEERSPLVAMAQQLSLCILPPHLSKIPPVTMTTTHRSPLQQHTSCALCPQTACRSLRKFLISTYISTLIAFPTWCICVCVCLNSLFSLYGVNRSYVVGGDVT